MTNAIRTILQILRYAAMFLPFIVLALLDAKANLKRENRYRQFLMPVIAVVYCIVTMVLLNQVLLLVQKLLFVTIPAFLSRLGTWIALIPALASAGDWMERISQAYLSLLQKANLTFLLFFAANALILLVHILLKRIIISFLSKLFGPKAGISALMESMVMPFYDYDDQDARWYLRRDMIQARIYCKAFFVGAVAISTIAAAVACRLYSSGHLTALFYPVFAVVCIGEVYFALNGCTKSEQHTKVSGEADSGRKTANYAMLRPALRALFGDKLSTDNTTVSDNAAAACTNDMLLHEMEIHQEPEITAYGTLMRRKLESGLELDQNYLISGRKLLEGKSILFNTPFYYDLIPYIFFPMNQALLRHRKVLIILGRHGLETDVAQWCYDGLLAVTNVPSLWKIGVLSATPQEELDVGIVPRSSIHDLPMHEANREFFQEAAFVVLIEPSKLVSTAQIGLNSIIRICQREGKHMTFCSTDKNCDGLLDALSHILMTSLTEVSATNRHTGASSYMCWDADGDHLQHRMLPNLSRFLGLGTELSFAALKNQVSETTWYGGDAFPVVDIQWIVRQYYYDLLSYASLPTTQEEIREVFHVSPNYWNAEVQDNRYMTVEDEAYNMFEVKRDFATRAKQQGFINVLSTEYLLKDYMAENDSIFNADPKAIPYIVADYAHTGRNVVLRTCLRMSAGAITEDELRKELMLIEADTAHLKESLWKQIVSCCQPVSQQKEDFHGNLLLTLTAHGRSWDFTEEVIQTKRKFSVASGQMETLYYLKDGNFIYALLGDLQNASYIAEDEKGNRQFLGTELIGHIFQKYLPGQFFTFNGKYYEMLRTTASGHVLVRRAADHITGRPSYRQVRKYRISNIVDSETMGDRLDISGLQVELQYADIRVETSAYWKMDRYNDFSTGRLVQVNGIPERTYLNKQLLRIGLPEDQGLTPEICRTITVLFNEVFRTLFAENQPYIVAVMPEEAQIPASYSLEFEGQPASGTNSIYILEDSQLDLGLLVAVKRNLVRIFSIICDYLEWNQEAVEASKNPPAAEPTPDYTVPEEQAKPEPKTIFGRIARAIRNFFRRIFHADESKARKEEKKRKKKEKKQKKEKDKQEQAEAKRKKHGEAAGNPPESESAETAAETAEVQETEPVGALAENETHAAGEEELQAEPPVETEEEDMHE
jgi:hypothetical protein